MGRIIVRNGVLVVVCTSGGTERERSSGVQVNAQMNYDQVQAAVQRALSATRTFFTTLDLISRSGYGADHGGIRAAAEARRICGELGIAVPEAPERRTRDAGRETTGRERRRPAAPRSPPRAPETPERHPAARRETRDTRPVRVPEINIGWVRSQLEAARGRDSIARGAADATYRFGAHVDRWLRPPSAPGSPPSAAGPRTQEEIGATLETFTALSRIPAFRLYLSMAASGTLTNGVVYPEFALLERHLNSEGEVQMPTAPAEVQAFVRAADMYIRYFLLNYAAQHTDYRRFRQEVAPGGSGERTLSEWRLTNIEGIASDRQSDFAHEWLTRLYLNGPMDSSTMLDAILFIRRWNLEHPARGEGVTQDRIQIWTRPQDRVALEVPSPPQLAPGIEQPAADPGSPVPSSVRGFDYRAPGAPSGAIRVAILGDSLTLGLQHESSLQSQLQRAGYDITFFGHDGAQTGTLRGLPRWRPRSSPQRDWLRHDVLNSSQHFSQVIIFAGAGDLHGNRPQQESPPQPDGPFTPRPFEEITGNLLRMYQEARAAGLRVVAVTLPPMGEFFDRVSGTRLFGSFDRYRLWQQVNDWIRQQQRDGTVDAVIDLASADAIPHHDTPSGHRALTYSERVTIEPGTGRRTRAPDGIHPDDPGYQAMVGVFVQQAFTRTGTVIPRREPAAGDGRPTAVIPHVGVFGDSIANGYGARMVGTLQGRISGATVARLAVDGRTIFQIRDRFLSEIGQARDPPLNIVVIEGGINHMEATDAWLRRAERAYLNMIEAAEQRGIRIVVTTVTPWAESEDSTPQLQTQTRRLNDWIRELPRTHPNVVVVDLARSPLAEQGTDPPQLARQYDSGDQLHMSPAGYELAARLINDAVVRQAQQAALRPGERTPTVEVAEEAEDTAAETLREFYSSRWSNGQLTNGLFTATRSGDATAALRLLRRLPVGHSSVESALRAFGQAEGQTDFDRAFNRIFNEYLVLNQEFRRFCQRHSAEGYDGIIRQRLELPGRTPPERRMIMRSIQAFINEQAETNQLLAQDLALLYGPQLLNTGRPTLLVNGMGDSRTVAALAVYQWRMSHPTAAVGEWARGLGITLPRIVPLTPAPGPRPPGQDAGSEPQDQQRRPPAVPY